MSNVERIIEFLFWFVIIFLAIIGVITFTVNILAGMLIIGVCCITSVMRLIQISNRKLEAKEK